MLISARCVCCLLISDLNKAYSNCNLQTCCDTLHHILFITFVCSQQTQSTQQHLPPSLQIVFVLPPKYSQTRKCNKL